LVYSVCRRLRHLASTCILEIRAVPEEPGKEERKTVYSYIIWVVVDVGVAWGDQNLMVTSIPEEWGFRGLVLANEM